LVILVVEVVAQEVLVRVWVVLEVSVVAESAVEDSMRFAVVAVFAAMVEYVVVQVDIADAVHVAVSVGAAGAVHKAAQVGAAGAVRKVMPQGIAAGAGNMRRLRQALQDVSLRLLLPDFAAQQTALRAMPAYMD